MANEIKTVDELRGAYPALVDQIEQAAALRATNAERQRMAAQSGEDGGRQRPLRCEVCPAAVHAPVRNMGKVQYRNRLLAGQVYCQREKVAVFLWERAIYGA